MKIPGRETVWRWYTERSPGDGPRYEAAPGACRVAAPVDIEPAPGAGVVTPDTLWRAFEDFLGYQKVLTDVADSGAGDAEVRYIWRKTPYAFPTPPRLVGQPLYGSSLTQGAGIGYASEGPEGTQYRKYRMMLAAETRRYAVREDREVEAEDGSPLFDAPTATGFPDEGWWLKNAGVARTRYISRVCRPLFQTWELKGGGMAFSAIGAYPAFRIPFGLPLAEGGGIVIYTHWLVPYPDGLPLKAVGRCLGCVNNSSFDGFTGGTLLLQSWEHTEPEPGPLGDLLVNVRYSMNYKPRRTGAGVELGHNAIFDQFLAKDYRLMDTNGDNTGRQLHLRQEFDQLFRPDPP